MWSTVSEFKAEERESAKGMHGVLAGICPSPLGNSLPIRVFLVSLARWHEDKGRKSFTLCYNARQRGALSVRRQDEQDRIGS